MFIGLFHLVTTQTSWETRQKRNSTSLETPTRHGTHLTHWLPFRFLFVSSFFTTLLRAYVLGCNASRNSMPFLIMASRVELGCWRCAGRCSFSWIVLTSFDEVRRRLKKFVQKQKSDILTTLLAAFVPSLPINYVFFASLRSQPAENISIANHFYLLVVQERLWSGRENALCKGLINGLRNGTRPKLTKCHLRMHSCGWKFSVRLW